VSLARLDRFLAHDSIYCRL